ncbi:Protein bir1 [Paramyrothecium foliicola]|nr:Protein bir1 [Paramyrothecium foliicola]
MASSEPHDQYFTYETRLASFQKSTKKRGSAANNRGAKQQAWPHKSISPASLASAGFYFSPSPENPDNTVCFLCGNGLDGWESGDDPLDEHLKHAPNCGWAIVAAIEVELGDYCLQDPSLPEMLVDAGWKYTPTLESEDMATCTYCQLALDGWERNDKPLDEHYKRSPDCSFFALINQSQATTKKGGRGKTARASKNSRLSVQSVATVTSETTSVQEMTAGPEDSVLTTASAVTQGGKKTKAKKPAASRAKKGKTKKEESEELVETSTQIDEQPQKTARGKKRASDAVEDSVIGSTEAPTSKRRATRPRGHAAETSTVMEFDDAEMSDDMATKKAVPAKKNQATDTERSIRQASTTSELSATSGSSQRGPPGTFPDDDEIERQLQADLDRQMSEDEEANFVVHDESIQSNVEMTQSHDAPRQSTDYEMFDPSPQEVDEADVDDELKALQDEMEAASSEELTLPKKGRKAGVRKVSKQTKAKAGETPASAPKEEDTVADSTQGVAEPEIQQDASVVSTETVAKKSTQARASTGKRGRGRPSKASLAARDVDELVEPEPVKPVEKTEAPVKRGRGRPSKASLASRASSEFTENKPKEAPVKRGRGRPSKHSLEMRASLGQTTAQTARPAESEHTETEAESHATRDEPQLQIELETAHSPVVREDLVSPPAASSQSLAQPPLTPTKIISPAPSARQPALSPSQSPQSSDAENQPPSSKPAASVTAKRVVLAPMATTPVRDSPSKRNILAGLQSSVPWTAVDLDAVLGTPRGADKENGTERFLKQGKELTSPEKRMTVEEWIYHNAAQAEKQLKHECEMMISRFESEGTRAMNVLESLKAE